MCKKIKIEKGIELSNKFNIDEILEEFLGNKEVKYTDLIFLCIGTDRSTGDSLGPVTGYLLENRKIKNNDIHIYGTLEHPVHAKNLERTLEEIDLKYPNGLVIAIDACLGNLGDVGNIVIQDKGLNPGLAVGKDLPCSGNISIIGVVNTAGNFEFMTLQNTRLFEIMVLAEKITQICVKYVEYFEEYLSKCYDDKDVVI